MSKATSDKEEDGLKKATNSDDGSWRGWQDYMAVKRQKLSHQFHEEKTHSSDSNMFSGIAAYVNGYTDPSADVLRRLITENGGQYCTYCNSRTTHTIATNLPKSKILQLKPSDKIVRPEWITDSLKEGRLLPDEDYLLFAKKINTVDKYLPSDISENPQEKHTVSTKSKREKEVRFSEQTHDAKDPNFINDYYAQSRLHMISTWCQEMKDFVKHLRQINDETFEGRQKVLEFLKSKSDPDAKHVFSDRETVYAHLDMDCFFVSVGLRDRPNLKGHPVVVTHSKGKPSSGEFESHSEIASCSYEARKAGVKNGMWLGDALKLCPNIKTIPYDFEKYKSTSKQLYEIAASFTLNIKAVSCDELFIDFTELCSELGATPADIATVLRQEIFCKTCCSASCGMGPNLLVARLATRKAKPNGQYYVPQKDVLNFMADQKICDLPGVGRSTAEKLDQLQVATCAELATLPMKSLQDDFGPKTGKHLYDFARGIDGRNLNDGESTVRKSVSCDVNYGIRFTEYEEVAKFLTNLCDEISRRLKAVKLKGRTICLKCLVRSHHAPVTTAKFLGHGMVDSFSKSITLHQATSNQELIFKESALLFKHMNLCISDLRGIGISVSKLESEVSSSNRSSASIMNYVKKNVELEQPDKSVEEPFAVTVKDVLVYSGLETRSAEANENFQQTSKQGNEITPKKKSNFTRIETPSVQKVTEEVTCSTRPVKNILFDTTEPDFCGLTSYDDVKNALKQWTESVEEILEDDCNLVLEYLISLINCSQMEKAYRLLLSFVRFIQSTNSEKWAAIYCKILKSVQSVVSQKYGLPLNLPDRI